MTEVNHQKPASTLQFDPREYAHFLADTGWTTAQKDEFTRALWDIVLNFVDLGFGLHPLQSADIDKNRLEDASPAMLACLATRRPQQDETAASSELAACGDDS